MSGAKSVFGDALSRESNGGRVFDVPEYPSPDTLSRLHIAFADPPYPGQSAKHYSDHPDFAGEVNHYRLAEQLHDYDGWILNTASTTLHYVLDALRAADHVDYRIMAWVKPFAAFKRNVSVAYAWEPVIVKAARKPVVSGRTVLRDWCAESITMKRGLHGAKPERLCHWLFECVGAEPTDELVDMFPGSGAVTCAWQSWQQTLLAGVAALEEKP
jgi:hypothetical protein